MNGPSAITTTSGHVATAWGSEVPEHAHQTGLSGEIDVYRLDMTATSGNSGGPAFRSNNQQVIGMIIEVLGNTNGGGWTATAIPSHYITEMLDKDNIPWKSTQ